MNSTWDEYPDELRILIPIDPHRALFPPPVSLQQPIRTNSPQHVEPATEDKATAFADVVQSEYLRSP
jgi:hypothetical protein